jgi:hypothetical protein
MSNIEAQIKATGMSQRNEVDLYYMAAAALRGICRKLDDDAGVPSTDYEATCFTAIFNGSIEDSRGNLIMNRVEAKDDMFFIITPNGIDDAARIALFYDMAAAFVTLVEKLDADSLTFTNYEATAATALQAYGFVNKRGDHVGVLTGRVFGPTAVNKAWLPDFLYDAVRAFYLLTHDGTTTGLDGDGTVTDTDYESLWYTATITMRVENGAGSVIGNDITVTP